MSGEGLSPDCSGNYEAYGIIYGRTYYRRCDGAYYIWYDGMETNITPQPDDYTPPWWQLAPRNGPTGEYWPTEGCEGTAIVSLP